MAKTWRRLLKEEIQEIADECGMVGWDGEDAYAISEYTKEVAELFVDLLPDNIIPPHIAPENTGEYSFDWNIEKDMVFSVSVSEDSFVFAGILGGKRIRGTVRLSEEDD